MSRQINEATWQRLQAHAGAQNCSVDELLNQLLDATAVDTPGDNHILDVVSFSVLIADARQPDYPIVFASTAFERITGYTPNEAMGRNCRFLQGNDRNQPDLDILRNALKNGQACTVTLRNYRKDGTLFWNELCLEPIYDDNGHLTHYIGVQNDVTEWVQTRQLYKTMIENGVMGIMVVMVVQDGRIKFANKSVEKLSGYTVEECMTLSIERMIHPDDYEQVREFYRACIAGDGSPGQIMFRAIRKDGSHYLSETIVTPIEFRGKPALQTVSLDVTEREEMLEQLRATSANLRATLNGSNQSFTLIDRNARVIDFDRDGAKIARDVFGKPLQKGEDIYDYVLDRDLESFTTNYNRALAGETFTVEKEFSGRDSTYYFKIDYYPITDTQGEILGVCMSTEDITRRKLAEIALQESEERYRLMADNVTDMISTHDMDGVYTFVSPSCERLLGYTPEELTGHSAYELFHPDDLTAIQKSHQIILQKQLSYYTVEYRIRRKTGDYIWLETISQIVTDETTGQPRIIIAVSRNITERKLMEEELARNITDLKLAQRIASIGNWTFDPEAGVPVWSTEIYKIYERNPELGPPSLEDYRKIYKDQDFHRFWTAIQTAIAEGKPYDINLNLNLPGGKQKWIRAICEPEPERGPAGHLLRGTIQDVSKIYRAQEALRESEARFRQLADNIDAVFWLIDVESNSYLYISPAYDIIWQRSHLELMEQGPEAFAATLHPEDRDRAMNMVRETSVNPIESASEIKHRIVRPSGEIRSVQTKFFPVRNQSGEVYRIAIITQDITELQKAEQRKFELALERERLHLLTEFIQNAAHEFRTPLATISTINYLMSHSDDPDYRLQNAEQIKMQIKRITRLVDSLLLLTQLESNETSVDNPVDLGVVLQMTSEKVTADCSKNHDLHVEIQPNLLSVMGDADYLGDALQQIMDNACRFTPEGGKIEVKTTNAEGRVRVEICDSGSGIPQDGLPHIFETFWRQDVAHSTPGFGLGLPIARKIIEQYGGEILVESEEGHGTIVQVSLPVFEAKDKR